MVSMKLVCCVVLVVLAVVESSPCFKKPKHCHKKRNLCPDEYIGKWFNRVSLTVDCDFQWIETQIKFLECKRDVAEYTRITELYTRFQSARTCFDSFYSNFETEIYGQVGTWREKFSPLSICYTERIVSCRKNARRTLYPEILKYRSVYVELIAEIQTFSSKYSIDIQPRAIAMPRISEYSFLDYYPCSPRSKELLVLVETCFNDYRYMYDLIGKLPECGPRTKLIEEITTIWVDFDRYRRQFDCDFYPRFLPCGEDQSQIDIIYIEYINKLRPYQLKFTATYFDIYTRYEDLCRERNIEFIDYIDYENFTPEYDIRGLYFPSVKLREYFSGLITTPRLDYVSCVRQWKELNFPCESNEWKRQQEIIRELKRLLIEYERIINRLMRDCYRKFIPYFEKCTCFDNFDVEYKVMIEEVFVTYNKELYPYLLDYRQQYYVNDECLMPILNQRGIIDVSRSMIAGNTFGYDLSSYLCDNDLREIIRWIENCFKTNYYGPVADLVQLKLQENCEEYKLKYRGLKDLECIWQDYRKILHELIRRLIELIRKKNCYIGSEVYEREIVVIRDWCRPQFIDLVGRFKTGCSSINGILEKLYTKNCGCKRSYKYSETSFEFSFSSSSRTVVAC